MHLATFVRCCLRPQRSFSCYLLNQLWRPNTDIDVPVTAGTIYLPVMDRYFKACTKTERVGGGERARVSGIDTKREREAEREERL